MHKGRQTFRSKASESRTGRDRAADTRPLPSSNLPTTMNPSMRWPPAVDRELRHEARRRLEVSIRVDVGPDQAFCGLLLPLLTMPPLDGPPPKAQFLLQLVWNQIAVMPQKPVLPDVFGRKLTWSEWLHKGSEWLWLGPLPKTQAELELEAQAEIENRPKDTIKLKLDR